MNAKENHVFATVFAVPTYRMQPADHTVFTFEERNAGSPQALQKWFYPGDVIGEEFIYPKAQLIKAATPPTQLQPRPVEPAPAPSHAEAQPVPATPAQQPVEVAQAAPAPRSSTAPAPAPAPAPKELPKTASDWPLLALGGALSVSLGIALRSKVGNQ